MALSSIPAANCYTRVVDAIARAIAYTQAAQDFLGVDSQEEAEQGNMHINVLPKPAAGDSHTKAEHIAQHPYILFGVPGDEESAFSMLLRSAPFDFAPRGSVEVYFVQLFDPTKTIQDQERIFENNIFSVVEQVPQALMDRAYAASVYEMHLMKIGRMTLESEYDEAWGDQQAAVFRFRWGPTVSSD